MQPCLIKEHVSRKRKRCEKTVRFDVDHVVIIDTYSAMDYDRGSIFSFPIQYKINPAILANTIPKNKPKSSSPDIETPTTPSIDKRKKPKLTVNTSVCMGGPLFFTKLSTNHVRHRVGSDEDETDEDDSVNDYLVPITTPSTSHPTFTF
ncbi:uncharacterized protein B0P05DRAFT_533870 [Gilbertella persicaria]|uniref:uncharacterized protein n=1 Tax=Gilbertella persicaria TaxID=101096 RepID=UPI002220D6AF|nr:uncharacterized protein B0P05DRAFT_533870 [Gilbertella persicaria]KAI8085826.1 hypothetical protein B0P05DRAFT_533870 [Gilbertella persicaria]